MKKFAVISAAALIGAGALASTGAEARGGGALAASVIGGLAAGALLGAAISDAHAAPAYGYGYPPAPVYRPTGYVRGYEYDAAPVYTARRFYDYGGPVSYGYGPVAQHWVRRPCDRDFDGYGRW